MPVGPIIDVALIQNAKVLDATFDLEHPFNRRFSGLGVLQPGDQPSSFVQRETMRGKS
jgi:hypothetical protein